MKTLTFIFLIYLSLNAQIIKGKITDRETSEPLPNCNISVLGTTAGTISNLEGYFVIKLSPGKHKLVFQYIGFESDTISIFLDQNSITKNISLRQKPLSTENIYVYSERYSKAEQLILRASIEKHKTIKLLQNYSCKSYTKTTISGYEDSLKNVYGLLLEFFCVFFRVRLFTGRGPTKRIDFAGSMPFSFPLSRFWKKMVR